MRSATQDRHYLEREADDFFFRNFRDADPTALRKAKRGIAAAIEEAGIRPTRVLEFGCNYGDLLNHYAEVHGAQCYGVEPSQAAVEFGRSAYGDRVHLERGTLAAFPLQARDDFRHAFDLVIVEDVFCWVSRETLFQSIANVDDALGEGGALFIREFLPQRNERNRNHHVETQDVYCYKPSAPHARMFTASGMYDVVWQKTWIDPEDPWVREGGRPAFESRWCDTVLRKSFSGYYRSGGDG